MLLLLLRQESANVGGEMFDQDHLFAAKLFGKNIADVLMNDKKGKYGIRVNGEICDERRPSEKEVKEWGRVAAKYRDTSDYRDGGKYNTLPNLWLLDSRVNREKGKKLPNLWYADELAKIEDAVRKKEFEEKVKRDGFLENMASADYLKLENFETVFEDREESLRKSLQELLKRV